MWKRNTLKLNTQDRKALKRVYGKFRSTRVFRERKSAMYEAPANPAI